MIMETNAHRNRVFLMGHLGKDPEVRELQGGRHMARMSVATNERFSFGEGQSKEDVQWHNVVAWGRTAEEVATQLRKGSKVALQGRLVHRSYDAKDGRKAYVTEVVMDQFELVEREAA